jgi:rod shape-determining protein MreC
MAIAPNNTAPLFGEGASSTLRLVVYMVIAIALMIADRRGDWLEHLRANASLVTEPVYRLAALPSEVARDARVALADRRVLTEQNSELSRQLLLAQTRLRRVEAVQEQNQRLQELLAVQKSLGLSVQLAKVVDVDFGPYKRHTIMLDLGSDNGIKVGQPVIDARGLVGQIVEVRPRSCTVLLISDKSHAVPVRIERTGLRTIARGTGALDTLELPNIPTSADVKAGDKLVTSGLGGRFPADFPVGVIRSVGNDATGMFAAAKATPDAALDRSVEVLVLHELANPVGPPAPAEEIGPPASLAEPVQPAPGTAPAPAPAPTAADADPAKQEEH